MEEDGHRIIKLNIGNLAVLPGSVKLEEVRL
mgnify:CR=1 FL=1